MIKTFIGQNSEVLDNDVNAFMRRVGKSLPVQTSCWVGADGKVYHKAVAYYDEPLKEQAPVTAEAAKPVKKAPAKDGSLWLQDDKTITGTFKNERVTIPKEVYNVLFETGRANHVIGETPVFIMINKFKDRSKPQDSKKPDYVIYAR